MKYKAKKTTFAALVLGLGLIGGSAYAIGEQTTQPVASNQMQANKDDGKTAGTTFLEANKTKPGVVTLSDGLQYKIIKDGVGGKDDRPGANDVVKVNYTGKFVDGNIFDSSKGNPVSFPVGGVIPGFSEALMLMNKGSIWEVYIPANLAYGERGAGQAIGPNQALVFTIELVDYSKKS